MDGWMERMERIVYLCILGCSLDTGCESEDLQSLVIWGMRDE